MFDGFPIHRGMWVIETFQHPISRGGMVLTSCAGWGDFGVFPQGVW